MGPIKDNNYLSLHDAMWNEKFAASILIVGIVAIGVAPFWLHDLIKPGTQNIIQHTISSVTLK